jgi:hypothetical protein
VLSTSSLLVEVGVAQTEEEAVLEALELAQVYR